MPEQLDATVPLVCVVEDNPADVRLIEEGLDAAAVDVNLEVYNNGRSAMEWVTGFDADSAAPHPALVLLDLNLPGTSGFEVLTAIRTETPFPDAPVVIVSSSENPDAVERAYESNANAYITKPADPDEYIRMIDAAVDFWIANQPTND
jgi:chemotaxis family two-component system response regulator Rcp1